MMDGSGGSRGSPEPAFAHAPALPKPPGGGPEAQETSSRPEVAPPLRKDSGDRGDRKPSKLWLLPTLAGAGLFVLGVVLQKGAGVGALALAGPWVVLAGVGLLVFGLVWGAKENGEPVNGAPVGGGRKA